ncbi:MAG: hypothetical protein LC789_01600 [Actinobacteria bacterium]|nr:hypothetical protein [Actinomycetota bacterium]
MTPLAAAPSGTAGPLGFLVVVLIGVAMVLLIRNMNSRLRKLPPSFEEPPVPEEERPEP